MARPTTNALQYYNRDTKDDDNLLYVEAVHGLQGYAIVHKLWQHIYGGPGGYFCEWNEINRHLFAKKCGVSVVELDTIITTCCGEVVGVFDKNMVELHHILTSSGIQKRWLKIVREAGRKNTEIIEQYRLIEINQQTGGGDNTPVTPHTTPPPVVFAGQETPQSKVKESKVKKSNSVGAEATTPPPSDDFNPDLKKEKQSRKPARDLPASVEEVEKYMFPKMKKRWDPGFINLQANKFFDHYSSNGWKQNKGVLIVSWKHAANMWIYRDLQRQQPTEYKQSTAAAPQHTPPVLPKPVPQTPPPVVLTPQQQEQKLIDFTESIYTEFKEGTVKEDNLPASCYELLKAKGLLVLDDATRQRISSAVNGDVIKAKKKALAEYFTRLANTGTQCVFNNVEA